MCAEKWTHGHKCAPTITLHALQEILDTLDISALSNDYDDSDEHIHLILSHHAKMGASGPKSIRFHGFIHDIPIVVLIDSSSTSSFWSTQVAAKLPDMHRITIQASVRVASGHRLHCTSAIPNCQFTLDGHTFSHDLKIL